jgi:hypothetical protein
VTGFSSKQITERHEALTQTVELIGHLQQKNEEAHQKNEILLEKNPGPDCLALLIPIERRISDLEDGRT